MGDGWVGPLAEIAEPGESSLSHLELFLETQTFMSCRPMYSV